MSGSYVQYQTPIPQEQYQQTGLIAAIVGFFVLAYFFMYLSLTQLPGRLLQEAAFPPLRTGDGGGVGWVDRHRHLLPGTQRGHLHVIAPTHFIIPFIKIRWITGRVQSPNGFRWLCW